MFSHLLSSLAGRVSLTPRRGLVIGMALVPALLAAALIGALVYAAPARGATGPPPPPPAGGNALTAAGNAQAGVGQAGASLPAPSGLLVDVTGAVAHPGVYRVAAGDRASVAIADAGGFTADADPTRLPDMAARLKDGQQVKVPSRTTPRSSSSGAGTTRVAAVNLNTATVEQLATVPGFTPDLVTAIIQYRTEYGGFAAKKELVDVLQMSAADYAVAQKYVTV
jgi:competence protein ComEA